MSEKISLANAPGEPTQPPAAPLPGDVGYVPPTEVVPLPSKGKLYPEDHPLYGSEMIEIRSMTAKDEDILTSRALLKQGKAISTLLRSCIADKRIDPDTMVAGDRNAALIAIRITGYGPSYSMKVECPACAEACEHEFDLSSLPIQPLGAEPVAPGKNAFAFVLPVCKKNVVFKLLTGADERDVTAILEKNRKASGPGGVDPVVTTKLVAQVISIGGESDRSRLSTIVRNLPARDARDLRAYIEKISPKVEMVQHFECPSCGESSEVDVPISTEFFWPSK
jgi:hypothetical protein